MTKKLKIALKVFFFSDTIKRSHDNSEYSKDSRVSWFADELFLYLHYKNHYRKRSSRLVKKFLIYLCEKYPLGFSDNYFVYKNKTLNEKIENGTSGNSSGN